MPALWGLQTSARGIIKHAWKKSLTDPGYVPAGAGAGAGSAVAQLWNHLHPEVFA